MERSTKTIIVLAVLVLLMGAGLALALIQYGRSREAHEQERDKLRQELSEQKEISDGLARAAANQVTAGDLKKIIRSEMKGIERDLNRLDGKVTAVSRITGRLGASMSRPSGSDSVRLVGGIPELEENIAWASPDGSQSLQIAWAKVRPAGNSPEALRSRLSRTLGPNLDKTVAEIMAYLADPDVPVWETGTHPLEFHVTTATAEVGGDDIYTQYVQISASEPGSEDRVPLAIVKADYAYTDPTAPEFRWFTPHLDAGIMGAFTPLGGTGGGTLGLSIMSYGISRDDNIWRFVRLGIAYDGDMGLVQLDPVGYNIARPLPLVSDIWIYPGLIIAPTGYGGGLSLVSTW